MYENSSCSRRDDRSFIYCTGFAGANCSGETTSMYTWSGVIAPRMILTSPPGTLAVSCARLLRYSPGRIFYGYFVTRNRWYLMSFTACPLNLYLPIPSLPPYRPRG